MRLAVSARRPFGRAEAERVEQGTAAVVVQRLPGALGDQAAEQRGRAAAIGPLDAGLARDRPLEDVAIAVERELHGVLAVARIAIGNRQLVPGETERHAENVMDRQAIAAGLLREIRLVRVNDGDILRMRVKEAAA